MSAWPRGARVGKVRHKYGAKPKIVDGVRFASTAEADRYQELVLLQRAGEIGTLELQPRFPLTIAAHGRVVDLGTYFADFAYHEAAGLRTVEDVKGFDTPLGRLKRKLAEALYGIEIRVIRKGKKR